MFLRLCASCSFRLKRYNGDIGADWMALVVEACSFLVSLTMHRRGFGWECEAFVWVGAILSSFERNGIAQHTCAQVL